MTEDEWMEWFDYHATAMGMSGDDDAKFMGWLRKECLEAYKPTLEQLKKATRQILSVERIGRWERPLQTKSLLSCMNEMAAERIRQQQEERLRQEIAAAAPYPAVDLMAILRERFPRLRDRN